MATSNNQNTNIDVLQQNSINQDRINQKTLTELKNLNENIKKLLDTEKIYKSLAPSYNKDSKDNTPKLGTLNDFIEGASDRLTDYKNFFLNRKNIDSKKEKDIDKKESDNVKTESNNDKIKLSIDLQKKSIELLDDILGEITLSRKIAEGSLKRDNKGETAGRYRDTRTGQLVGSGIERASENDIEKIKKIKTKTEEKAKPLLLQELKSERKDIKQVTNEFKEGKMSESKYNESVANIKQKYKESKAKIKQDSNLEASKLIKQSRTGLLSNDSIVAVSSNSSITSQQSVLSSNKIAEDISSMRKAMLGDGIAVRIMNSEEIKTEGGRGGVSLPGIELPGKGKMGLPGAATLGSKALKFMTGTGGKALGAAAAIGLGAYTAYSGYTEAEGKKQQEVQAIDQQVKLGKITPEKAEELKKEISAKTIEDKGGAIGKGTGMAAGAIAGAKAGSMIGTFLGGPIGTAVGGLAGGAIGGIAGSSVGQNIGGAIGKGIAGFKSFLGIEKSEEITKTNESAEKESTNIQFSEMEFAKNDPENYKKFVEFKDQKTQELYKKELEARKLTEKSPPRILETIRSLTQTKAKEEAIKKFKKEIEAAGAGSIEMKKRIDTPVQSESKPEVVKAPEKVDPLVKKEKAKEDYGAADKKLKEAKEATQKFESENGPTEVLSSGAVYNKMGYKDKEKQAQYEKLKRAEYDAEKERSDAGARYASAEGVSSTLTFGEDPDRASPRDVHETQRRRLTSTSAQIKALKKRGYTDEQLGTDNKELIESDRSKFTASDGKTYSQKHISKLYEDRIKKELAESITTEKPAPSAVSTIPDTTQIQPSTNVEISKPTDTIDTSQPIARRITGGQDSITSDGVKINRLTGKPIEPSAPERDWLEVNPNKAPSDPNAPKYFANKTRTTPPKPIEPATSMDTIDTSQPVIKPGGGRGQLDTIDTSQPVIKPGGGRGQLDTIDTSQPVIKPGGGRGQLDTIDTSQPIIRPGGGRGKLDTIDTSQPIIRPGGGRGKLDTIDLNQQGTTVTSAPSTKSDTSAVTTSKESFKGTFIANEPVVPGKPLSEKQMAVIEMSKSMGNKYSPEVESQYQKQKSEQIKPSTNVETSKPADRAAPLTEMSQENQELKRGQSTPIFAPPIISNSVQSTNTQTLAPIKAQPRSITSSSLEKYIERTAVYA